MSFLKVGSAPSKKRRLYISTFTHESGLTSIKIGVASGASSVDRGFQQLRDYFMKLRFSPKWTLKRDREVPADKAYEYENILHKYFIDCKYVNAKRPKFDGFNEHYLLPIADAIQAYEAVLAGMIPENKYKLPEVKADIDDEVAF